MTYKDLDKEERKALRMSYEKSKRGANLTYTLNKLVLEGCFLLLCTVIIIGGGLFTNEMTWWMWTLAGLTTFCGLVFLIGQFIIRRKEYNKYLRHDNTANKKKLTKGK